MLKNEGFFSLYKGAFLKILFTIPMITISFSFTEFFKQKILESKILETFIWNLKWLSQKYSSRNIYLKNTIYPSFFLQNKLQS